MLVPYTVVFLKSLVVFAFFILVIGMIKPKWVLFWMKQPDRLSVTFLFMLIFMVTVTALAKMTLKPKPKEGMSREQANEIQLDR